MSNTHAAAYIFLVMNNVAAAAGSGASVVLAIPPKTYQDLVAPAGSNPFQLDQLGLDTDTNGGTAYVTAFIVN